MVSRSIVQVTVLLFLLSLCPNWPHSSRVMACICSLVFATNHFLKLNILLYGIKILKAYFIMYCTTIPHKRSCSYFRSTKFYLIKLSNHDLYASKVRHSGLCKTTVKAVIYFDGVGNYEKPREIVI